MFSSRVPNKKVFKNTEDEIKYLRKQNTELRKKNQELRKSVNAPAQGSKKRSLPTEASPASKKHKSDSLDPFDFSIICEDIQPLITQHLTAKDILVMTEVSKSWNDAFRAEIYENTTLHLPADIREYQNIETVKKFNSVSMNLDDCLKFSPIALVAKTAESLKIVIEKKRKATIHLSNLKKLELEVNSRMEEYPWIFRMKMEKLEELKISCGCSMKDDNYECIFCLYDKRGYDQFQEDFIKFFASLKNLKHLDLSNCGTGFLSKMFYDGRQPMFQLESLKCDDTEKFQEDTIMDTLKSLEIDFSFYQIKNALNVYDNLQSLELKNYKTQGTLNRTDPDFSPNKNIKHFSMKPLSGSTINEEELNIDAKFLLKAVPDVETFYVPKLTSELMRFIAATNLKMKRVTFSEVAEETLEEYKEMQEQQDINRDIQFIHETL